MATTCRHILIDCLRRIDSNKSTLFVLNEASRYHRWLGRWLFACPPRVRRIGNICLICS